MAEEDGTPEPVERWRQVSESFSRRDFDALESFFVPGAVWEAEPLGLRFEGRAAIRSFLEEWISRYEEYQSEIVETHILGSDVLFAVNQQDARPLDSDSPIEERWAFTVVYQEDMIVQVVADREIDHARAAAERLAEERG